MGLSGGIRLLLGWPEKSPEAKVGSVDTTTNALNTSIRVLACLLIALSIAVGILINRQLLRLVEANLFSPTAYVLPSFAVKES